MRRTVRTNLQHLHGIAYDLLPVWGSEMQRFKHALRRDAERRHARRSGLSARKGRGVRSTVLNTSKGSSQ